MHDCPRHDVRLEVLAVRPLGVRFGNDRNPVPRDLDEKVVELVTVDGPLLARGEPHLPHPYPVVFEDLPGADVPQGSVVGHVVLLLARLAAGARRRDAFRGTAGEAPSARSAKPTRSWTS